MNIAFTGHRPNKLNNDYDLTSEFVLKIKNSIMEHVIISHNKTDLRFIVGMALGIDTLAAMIAIENNIPFTAAIPFKGQEGRWPRKSRDRYNEILSKADKIVLISDMVIINYKQFEEWPVSVLDYVQITILMEKRNKWMVDHADKVISVWDGSPGGTANCTRYALDTSTPIHRINPTLII